MSTPSPSNLGHEAEEEMQGKATKTVKPEPGENGGGGGSGNGTFINIKVQSQTAKDAFFRIKRDVKLRRLMDMYCGKHSLNPKAVLFLGPEGVHIRPDQTPDDVGLVDGDAIDMMLTQEGGAARSQSSA